MFFEEDQFDRLCRIVLAWMIFTERTIEIELWMSSISARFFVKRLWIWVYYRRTVARLKRIPIWGQEELEALTGKPLPRAAAHAHIEGLKREQTKKE